LRYYEGAYEEEFLLGSEIHERITGVELEDVLFELREEVVGHKAAFFHETIEEGHQRLGKLLGRGIEDEILEDGVDTDLEEQELVVLTLGGHNSIVKRYEIHGLIGLLDDGQNGRLHTSDDPASEHLIVQRQRILEIVDALVSVYVSLDFYVAKYLNEGS